MELTKIEKLARLIRYYILTSTTAAGSGHATSSLSAVELATVLFFKYLRYDLDNPDDPANDRFILSKGHGSPLLYSLYAAAGKVSEKELLSLRKFDSPLEGHPSMRFPYTEVPTGSLGQGLSVGAGIALAMRRYQVSSIKYQDKSVIPDTLTHDTKQIPKVFVLLGDGEMAEGQVWEAINLASYYKLNNLIAILDVNRLGQSQQTMLEHDVQKYAQRVASFGWRTYVVEDGHDVGVVDRAFEMAIEQSRPHPDPLLRKEREPFDSAQGKPAMIIAKTVKGKGVSFLEDKNGMHGVALKKEEMEKALTELGEVDKEVRGEVRRPEKEMPNGKFQMPNQIQNIQISNYKKDEKVATRKAYGNALVNLGKKYENVVVLDGDVKNSTYAELFAKAFPDRYFEMFIAEQNMVSAAVGMAKLGLVPFVSSFGCFLMRAADQLRMASLSGLHLVVCGSHGGVSIGEDGPSQMALEDLSLFRTLSNSIVLYGSDAVSTEKLVHQAYSEKSIIYIRTTRPVTPILYEASEEFPVGKSKTLKSSAKDVVTVAACGITVFEAIKASEELKEQDIAVRVIDCYSIKPIDVETLKKAATETKAIITVEDHYAVGGLGDAVLEALADDPKVPIHKLAVRKMPRSGEAQELLDYEDISARAIVEKIKTFGL